MAEFFECLTEKQIAFIAEQPMFFIATAAPGGRINLSPKGMDTFRVIRPDLVGYLDLTGSGNETAAHLNKDGRATVMFNSFGESPLILRLYGRGRVAVPGSAAWEEHIGLFNLLPGARQIILIDVQSVQTSCGYAVPVMELKHERKVLADWARGKGEDGLRAYRRERNTLSIDGLETGLTEN